MNTRRLPTVTVLLVLLALVTGVDAFEGRVIGIVDGDTITVLLPNSAGGVQRPVRVRLNGIDAPEREQPFSARAKQFVAQLAFGQVVEIVVHDYDRYGRTIADVQLPEGRSLNQELVRAGYAWWFRKFHANGESH